MSGGKAFCAASKGGVGTVSLSAPRGRRVVSLRTLKRISRVLSMSGGLCVYALNDKVVICSASLGAVGACASCGDGLPDGCYCSSQLALGNGLVLVKSEKVAVFSASGGAFTDVGRSCLGTPVVCKYNVYVSGRGVVCINSAGKVAHIRRSSFLSPLRRGRPVCFSGVGMGGTVVRPSRRKGVLGGSLTFASEVSLTSSRGGVVVRFTDSSCVGERMRRVFRCGLRKFSGA